MCLISIVEYHHRLVVVAEADSHREEPEAAARPCGITCHTGPEFPLSETKSWHSLASATLVVRSKTFVDRGRVGLA